MLIIIWVLTPKFDRSTWPSFKFQKGDMDPSVVRHGLKKKVRYDISFSKI